MGERDAALGGERGGAGGGGLAAAGNAQTAGGTQAIDGGQGAPADASLSDASAGTGGPAGRQDCSVATVRAIELDAAASQELGTTAGCTYELNGRLLTPACSADLLVELNGAVLTCGSPDGVRVVDERHLELTGSACEAAQSAGVLVSVYVNGCAFAPD